MGTNSKTFEVYVHIFPNGKRYYGQSCDSVRRWANGNGYSRQKIVYSAIKKYGWENIQHIILHKELTKEQADEIERKLIAEHQTDTKGKGYNVLIGGKTAPRHGRTAEQNLKDSLSHMKSVDCYSRDGKFVANYRSIIDAAKAHSVNFKPISSCCTGRKKSAYGFVWRFKGEPFDKFETVCQKGGQRKKPVVAYRTDGTFVGVFDGVVDASTVLGVNATSVSCVCKGRKQAAKGYVFKYAEEGGTNK